MSVLSTSCVDKIDNKIDKGRRGVLESVLRYLSGVPTDQRGIGYNAEVTADNTAVIKRFSSASLWSVAHLCVSACVCVCGQKVCV